MREIIAGRPAVRALARCRPTRRSSCSPTSPTSVEIIERVAAGAAAPPTSSTRGEVAGDGAISVYRNTDEFVDLCRRPARAVDGPARPLQAAEGRRRVLARQREGPDAAAHLRHGVGVEAGARRAPPPARGGREARPPQAGRRARPAQLPARARRRARRVAPEGRHRPQADGGLQPARATSSGGYQFVYTPHLANAKLFETSRPPRLVRRRHVPADGDGQRHVLPEADELPDALPDLRQPAAQLPRAAAAPVRARHGVPLRAGRHAARADADPRLHPGRQPHLLHPGADAPTRSPSLLDFVLSVLRAFGFDDFTFNLSTKDPKKYVGTDEIWDEATEALRAGARPARPRRTRIKEGDAAFYGPKIDIDVRDAIGRSWQLSTIQFDFNHPERFDLEYVGADNARHRPIMLHRALFGSIERFFGVLLEHYAGAFPTWLAPVQVAVLPVADGARGVRRRGRRPRSPRPGCRVDIGRRRRPARQAHPRTPSSRRSPTCSSSATTTSRRDTVGVNPRGGEVERGVAARRSSSPASPTRSPTPQHAAARRA